MSEQLNDAGASDTSPSSSPQGSSDERSPTPGRGRRWAAVLGQVLLVVVAGAATGALLGVLWEWAWTPPTGAAWEKEWYLDPDGAGQDVSSTGWFTVIGLVGGVAYGSLAARWGLGRPLATLAGVVVGSFLAAYVMYTVGHALGPPDPRVVALTAGDWEPIVSDLRLAGVDHPMRPFSFETGAVLAPSIGALVGLVGVFLGGSGRRRPRRGAHD